MPDGWRLETKTRSTGKSAGQTDKYFYNRQNMKFRSVPEAKAFLEKTLDALRARLYEESGAELVFRGSVLT